MLLLAQVWLDYMAINSTHVRGSGSIGHFLVHGDPLSYPRLAASENDDQEG